MSSVVWRSTYRELSDSFRIIAPDLRGHGKSLPHMDGFHIKGCAQDIAALMEHLDVSDAIIAGWSLGSLITIEAYQLCKDRLSGVVLISGTPRFVQSVDFPFGLSRESADGMAKKVSRNVRRALDGFSSLMFAPEEDGSECVQRLLQSIPAPATETALQALEALVEADLRDSLTVIDSPTLIMNGDSDVICLPTASEYMCMKIPMSQQIVFSGCGHVPFLTQSSKFNACLEDFSGRVHAGVY
jgi:pimeloyl-[acyl-carrier protein] methyl ester esterase